MIYNCNSEIDENQIKPVLTDLSIIYFPSRLTYTYTHVQIYLHLVI